MTSINDDRELWSNFDQERPGLQFESCCWQICCWDAGCNPIYIG